MARNAIYTASAPVGPRYSQAVVAGNLVFVAGTVGKDMATGTWPEGLAAQAEQALKNLAAVLAEAGCSLDDVVKTTTFLTPAASYAEAEEAYTRAFTSPLPARSAPVVSLPVPEALISIEAIAVKPGA
jgi:2-iminobutanoate/2-iminopropanoate deaminase